MATSDSLYLKITLIKYGNQILGDMNESRKSSGLN